MLVREEHADDVAAVADLHRRAFGDDGEVSALVADLRRSLVVEPGLSLVAEASDGSVVGHALFTRSLLDAPRQLVDVQVLSPLGVLPEWQRQGVGSALVRHGLAELAARGVALVFLEGSPDYYPRFGFVPGSAHGFRRPSLRIPDVAFQVCLLPGFEPWMSGTLVYRREFWDHDMVGLRA